MIAHVLLNLLNEFRKRNKMPGLLSILFLFGNEFNKSNKTGAQMLDSIYHMTYNLKSYCRHENVRVLPCSWRYNRHCITFPVNW